MRRQAIGCIIAVFTATLSLILFTALAAHCQTRGEINFIAGDGPINPLDPDSPATDLANPAGVNVTNDSDSLSLNAVPDFVFAQTDGTAFPALLTGEKCYALHKPERPYVQVSDLRGNGGGWKLSVSASRFLKDGAPALNGAKIRLLGGTAHSSNPALSPPTVNDAVIIECAGQDVYPVDVAATSAGAGMGAWIIRWYLPDGRENYSEPPVREVGIELYIPPDTAVLPGDYSATLYWTLSDTA